jgi:hypothetical protein
MTAISVTNLALEEYLEFDFNAEGRLESLSSQQSDDESYQGKI